MSGRRVCTDNTKKAIIRRNLADGHTHTVITVATNREIHFFTRFDELVDTVTEPQPDKVRLTRRQSPALIEHRCLNSIAL